MNKTTEIIAVVNQKGGVGKTTTAMNLGAAYAATGAKVLLVDNDSQAHLTTHAGIDAKSLKFHMYHVLMGLGFKDSPKIPITSILMEAPMGMHIAPSGERLNSFDVEVVTAFDREYLLRKALKPVIGVYDYIIIDCGPQKNFLQVNAIIACTKVLIPLQTQYLASEGLMQLIDTVAYIKANGANPDMEIAGILLTMTNGTRLSKEVSESARVGFEGKVRVFNTTIPQNTRLAEAPARGLSIFEYDEKSVGALAYRALAQEMKDAYAEI